MDGYVRDPARAAIRPDIISAWCGPSLLVVTTRGECGESESLSGYFFRETRFLHRLRLDVNGGTPRLCEVASLAPDTLAFTYTYPEVPRYGGGGTSQAGDETPVDDHGILQRAIALQLTYAVRPDGLTIALHASNDRLRPVDCEIGWSVDTDFADIQEVQNRTLEQQAPIDVEPDELGLTFVYRHARLQYRSRLSVTSHGRWRITASRLAALVHLEPHAAVDLGLRVEPSRPDGSPIEIDAEPRLRARDAWRGQFARLSAPSNRVIEEIVGANLRDFTSFPLLEGEPDEWLTLQAGIPLYPALFGRDALTAGWQAAWVDGGRSLDATMTRLGRLQGDRIDDWRDEQPGRTPQQVRQGPVALLNLNPTARYYADFASPLMFVIALAQLYAWTGETALVHRHWRTAERILEWARTYGDQDADGYLEYQTRSPKGTKHQGWKDSGGAIVYEDGSPVPAPLGTCELQGYWFAAQQLMAILSWAVGRRAEARAHWRRATALKRRFNRDWWIDDRSCIALAMDARKRPVIAVSSNIGHCIASGIVSDEHLPAAVDRLFAPDMFSGWGIRTLSSEHPAYRPLSYHDGSIWPVEQATIAFGLRRFGFNRRASELALALFDLAALYPDYRIPECVGGYARSDRPTPGAYPQANAPQLWNSTALALIVHTMLGLQPVAPLGLFIVSPDLSAALPEIILHDVQLGAARATLRFWRDGHGRSHCEVLERRGRFHLLQQPPPESLSAGITDRVRDLLDTLRQSLRRSVA